MQPHLLAAGTTGLTVLASGLTGLAILAVLAGRGFAHIGTTRLHFFIPV